MSEYLYFIMLSTGLAALGGLTFWLKALLRGSREVLESAHSFGVSFKPSSESADLFLDELSHFALFRGDGQKSIHSLMAGTTEGVDTIVFDFFRYSTFPASNPAHYLVAVFTQWTWAIPDFRMNPSTMFDRLTARVGFAKITLASDLELSKHYTVHGPDGAAIRSLFRPEVLAFFASHPSSLWRPYPAMEGHGPRLVIFQRATTFLGNPVPPTLFLSDARRILAVVRTAFPTVQ